MPKQSIDTATVETLLNAVKSDHHSQAAYVGRVKQTERIVVSGPDGQPIEFDHEFYISWESIRSILDLVRDRAGLTS